MATTTSVIIPPAVPEYFSRDLLRRALPKLHHARFAVRKPLPQRSGNTMVFRRLPALSPSIVPLTEGIAPGATSMSKTDITSSIKQYGAYIEMTDLVEATVESQLLREANKLLAEQMAQSLDIILRDEYSSGTVVLYGGADLDATIDTRAEVGKDIAGFTNGKGSLISTKMLDRVIRTLDNQNATRFTEMIEASTKFAAYPVRPSYWGIVHPDVAYTLQNLAGFISVEEYSSTSKVMDGEIGAYKNLRFLETTFAKKFENAGATPTSLGVMSTGGTVADVYACLFFAEDAVALVPFDKLTVESIVKPVGSSGTLDPLNQISTSGWKRTGTQVILNDTFLARLEVTAEV